jgi:hypothetical protein
MQAGSDYIAQQDAEEAAALAAQRQAELDELDPGSPGAFAALAGRVENHLEPVQPVVFDPEAKHDFAIGPALFFAVQSPAGEETGTMTAYTERSP